MSEGLAMMGHSHLSWLGFGPDFYGSGQERGDTKLAFLVRRLVLSGVLLLQ